MIDRGNAGSIDQPIDCRGCLRATGWCLILSALLGSDVSAAERDQQAKIAVESAILKTIESTTLSAQLPGILQDLNVAEGDNIGTGQLLGRIKDEAARLELEQNKLLVEMARKKQANDIDERLAEKSKAVADNEYQRALKANAKVPKTYPPNELDRLKLLADQAELELERARYLKDMAHYDVEAAISDYRKSMELLKRHQLLAPSTGVVTSVEKRAGEWVEAGTKILTMVRLDRLRVEGFVQVNQAMMDLQGRKAKVLVDAGHEPITVEALVTFVSPDVNPVNSQVRIFLEVDNTSGKLRPGVRVTAYIAANE